MESCESPPPEKMLRRPKNWLFEKNEASATLSTPGIGIAARKRKRASAPTRKRMRRRSAASPNASFILWMKELIMAQQNSRLVNGALCGEYSRAGRGRERAALDHEGLGDGAFAKNLHEGCTPLGTAHEPFGEQGRGRDRLARAVRGLEGREIHDRRCDAISLDRACAVLAVAAALRQLLDNVAH